MNEKESNLLQAQLLTLIARELIEVEAAGPTGYWNQKLAERLCARADQLRCTVVETTHTS